MPLFIARILLLGSDPAESDGEHRRRTLRTSRRLDDRVFTELAQARADFGITYPNNLDTR